MVGHFCRIEARLILPSWKCQGKDLAQVDCITVIGYLYSKYHSQGGCLALCQRARWDINR